MELQNAKQQKTFIAEKQISYVRAIVIVFASSSFFLLRNDFIHRELCYILIGLIYLYGGYVLLFKPYEKYPIFLASWFTYLSDAIFTTLWIYATGGFYSPYYVIFYTSIIAVAFRFGIRTTLFTAAIYTVCYFGIITYLGHLAANEAVALVRTGFIFIIGFLTSFITQETLHQTQQKFLLKKLVDEADLNRNKLEENSAILSQLNSELQMRNDIFSHAEQNADIGSYYWKVATNEIKYSDNMFHLLNCSPGEFAPTVEAYLSFVHPDEREEAKRRSQIALQTREVTPAIRKMLVKDEVKYFRTSGKFTGSGDQLIMIGTVQDVTADVHLKETLRTKNIELESINNELSSFNYIASHDLQEPVRKIYTFSNLILQREKDSLTSGTKDYLTRITTAASRMQRLIEAFSNYSRIGTSAIKFELIDLNKIVEDAKQDLADRITENQVEISYRHLPAIYAVPFHIQQLFENLLSNAIKYRNTDVSPKIEITVQKTKGSEINNPLANKDNEYWELKVKDNGIGFDQQYSEKIFEVFQRLHSKEQYPGTGIGLAICKKVVLTHRGFIEASSEVGEGSEFRIYIPSTGLN